MKSFCPLVSAFVCHLKNIKCCASISTPGLLAKLFLFSFFSCSSYCISKSFAGVYGVQLTAAHLPLQGSDCDQSTNIRTVKLNAGHTQVRFFQLIP